MIWRLSAASLLPDARWPDGNTRAVRYRRYRHDAGGPRFGRGAVVAGAGHSSCVREDPSWSLIFLRLGCPLLASGVLALGGKLRPRFGSRSVALSTLAAPVLFLGIEFTAYGVIEPTFILPLVGPVKGLYIEIMLVTVGFFRFGVLFDINFTAPHRHYKRSLVRRIWSNPNGSARTSLSRTSRSNCPVHRQEPRALSSGQLRAERSRLGKSSDARPAHRLLPVQPTPLRQPAHRLRRTESGRSSDAALDLGTAMAISGAAAAPQMGTGTHARISASGSRCSTSRLGYWVRNPMQG